MQKPNQYRQILAHFLMVPEEAATVAKLSIAYNIPAPSMRRVVYRLCRMGYLRRSKKFGEYVYRLGYLGPVF